MKLIKYINKSLWLLPFIGLAACSDYDDYASSVLDIPEDSYELSVAVPNYKIMNLGSRADEAVSNIQVAYYENNTPNDADNSHIKTVKFTSGFTVNENNISLTIPKVADAKYIQVIVNADLGNEKNPANVVIPTTNKDNNIFWGITELPPSGNQITGLNLIHHNAKVSVSVSSSVSSSIFTMTSYGVFGSATTGTLAPSNWSSSNPTLTLPSPVEYSPISSGSEADLSNQEKIVFETDKDKAKVIIKGKYNGSQTDTYYVAEFKSRKDKNSSAQKDEADRYEYTSIGLIRGHKYNLIIDNVKAEGYSTLKEALAAKGDNRLTILLEDTNVDIVDIISCSDYALGVNQPLPIPATVIKDVPLETILQIVSSYSESPKVNLTSEWLSKDGEISEGKKIDGTDPLQYSYTLKLKAKPNKELEKRTQDIEVVAGDLKLTVTITQEAYDLYRSGDRDVEFKSDNNIDISSSYINYMEWLDECFGVTAADNRGVVRNKGLHFPPVSSYSLTYRIPKMDDDREATIDEGFKFDITSEPGYYVITASANGTPAVGTFQFENSDGQTLVYDLYKTGIFHEMTDDILENATSEYPINTGWYYYELVKANDVWILDRNLGATTNAAYKSTSSDLRNNKGACGAYFRIANSRMENVSSSVQSIISTATIVDDLNLPSGFDIPTQSQIENINIKATDQQITGGSAIVATVNEKVFGFVANNTIFFPHTGYYDEVSRTTENDESANVWTKCLHCYNQGFDSKRSDEFGYWYRCLNGSASTVGASQIRKISQIRYVGGAEGTDNGAYRYMPIRIVYGSSGNTDLEAPEPSTTITLYWDNCDKNWSSVFAYYYKGNDEPYQWHGISMTDTKQNHIWKIEIDSNYEDGYIIFNDNANDQAPSKTGFTIKSNHIYSASGDEGDFNQYKPGTDWYIYGQVTSDGKWDFKPEYRLYTTDIQNVYKTKSAVTFGGKKHLGNDDDKQFIIFNKFDDSQKYGSGGDKYTNIDGYYDMKKGATDNVYYWGENKTTIVTVKMNGETARIYLEDKKDNF